jgi:hypothetical protein
LIPERSGGNSPAGLNLGSRAQRFRASPKVAASSARFISREQLVAFGSFKK